MLYEIQSGKPAGEIHHRAIFAARSAGDGTMNTLKKIADADAYAAFQKKVASLNASSLLPVALAVHVARAKNVFDNAGKIAVIDEDGNIRYTLPASAPAQNDFGYESGYTWGEEYEAGRLYVGQMEDGDSYGAVWAQSGLPAPVVTPDRN